MASVMLKEIYEARLGNKRAVDVATWLSGGREEEELRKGEVMEVTPVTVGSQGGTWWATELWGFSFMGLLLSIYRGLLTKAEANM